MTWAAFVILAMLSETSASMDAKSYWSKLAFCQWKALNPVFLRNSPGLVQVVKKVWVGSGSRYSSMPDCNQYLSNFLNRMKTKMQKRLSHNSYIIFTSDTSLPPVVAYHTTEIDWRAWICPLFLDIPSPKPKTENADWNCSKSVLSWPLFRWTSAAR